MAVSDVSTRAARIFFALGLTAALGALAHYLSTNEMTARGVKCATATAGIIIVVAQTPLVGGQPRALLENTLGTVTGATLGVIMFFLWDNVVPFEFDTDYYLRLLTAPMVGALGVFLGSSIGMDGAGKVVAMTYLLVVVNNVEEGFAENYAVYRVTGIVVGMILSQITATLVFQRSATEDVLDKLRASLGELTELNRLVWGNQRKIAAAEQEEASAPGPSEEQMLEGFQARINATLNGALTNLPLTASEVRVIGGAPAAWWFVPWPCAGASCGGWHLNQDRVRKAVTAIRRVNRLQVSFWLLLSHPPHDPIIRDNQALAQLLRDYRFLTQAVLDGMLSALNRLSAVDGDALVYLNTKILDSSLSVSMRGTPALTSASSPRPQPPPSSADGLAMSGGAGRASPSPASLRHASPSPAALSHTSSNAGGPPPAAKDGDGLGEPLLAADHGGGGAANGVGATPFARLPSVAVPVGGRGVEDSSDDGSIFHRVPLQQMPTGLAAFERSVLTPEVWWHTFQFLLVQLAAEGAALQDAIAQLVVAIKTPRY